MLVLPIITGKHAKPDDAFVAVRKPSQPASRMAFVFQFYVLSAVAGGNGHVGTCDCEARSRLH